MKLDNMISDDSEYIDGGRLGNIKVPKSKARMETKEWLIKKTQNPELIRQAAEQGAKDQDALLVKASTDESWTVEFDKRFNVPHWEATGYNLNKVKEFIASQIQKEREKWEKSKHV